MKKRNIAAAGLFLLVMAAQPALQASPSRDEDFGIWSQNDIEYKFNPRWKMRAGEEIRFHEHQGIYYYDTHAGVQHQPSQFLAAGAEYLQVRQVRSRSGKYQWYWEERPRIYLTPRFEWQGFLLENRNLLEFRIKEDADNTIRYRNMSTLTAPWKWTRFQFQPYVADEIFVESDRNGLVENRLYAGLKLRYFGPFQGGVFYLRQSQKNNFGSWKDLNFLGLQVKLLLGRKG